MNPVNRIDIPVSNVEQKEILVAWLSEDGYDAFEETDDCLSAYIDPSLFKKETLESRLAVFHLQYSKSNIEPANWNQLWESAFEPVVIDDFVFVRAHFHPTVSTVLHDIVITPKMSFGTAHHPTTFMMIQEMRRVDSKEGRVCDFGTGTGILSILAEKLGASEIVAIDYDEWSVINARENMQVNDCSKISIYQSDSPCGRGMFDIILANINLNVLLEKNVEINQVCNPGGFLLLSGFLVSDKEKIVNLYYSLGFSLEHEKEKDNWCCLLLKKNDMGRAEVL